MTRENLLQAIYDNVDDWSCQDTCLQTIGEENPQEVCMKCVDKLLAEYEKKIRADGIDEFWTEFDKQIKSKGKQTHFYTEFLRIGMNIKEQLKEQNNDD